MKGLNKYILLLFLFTLPAVGWSQYRFHKMKYRDRLGDSVILRDVSQKPPRKKQPKLLSGGLSGGLMLRSNGWGLFIDKSFLYGNSAFGRGNRNKFFQAKIIELSVGEIKNSKEKKSNSLSPGIPFSPNSYILGKENNFFRINLGYGYRKLIAGKPDKGTVSIHWAYLGGFSAGLIKPYYLKISGLGETKYSEEVKKQFVTPGLIEGSAGLFKGFDEIDFDPGIFIKTGLHFDFSKKPKSVMALEAGVYGSYYFKEIPLMVGQKARKLFFSFYASIQFGGKW